MSEQKGNFIDDPSGLTAQEFKWAYWWAEHRKQLRVWWVALFGIFTLAFVLYDLFYFTIYSATWVQHNRVVAGIASNVVSVPAGTVGVVAQDLVFDDAQSVSSVEGYADFVVRVDNVNDNWAVERLEYQFTYSGGETAVMTAELLPQEETYLFAPNVSVDGVVRDVQLNVVDTVWRRATRESLRAPEFEVQDPSISDAVTTDEQVITRVQANIRNLSVVDFNSAAFTVVLLDSSGSVVAVQDQTISDFRSLEVAPFIVTFNRRVGGARNVLILPKTELP